jgi:Trypsin-like peptidase domain
MRRKTGSVMANRVWTAKSLVLILLVAGVAHAQSVPPRKDIPAIAKAANGVIVSIITSDKDGHPVAQGTGFLVSKDGRIVTNYHVIKDASSAIVKLPDGAFYEVEGVVAFDKTRDLAIIKAHGQNFSVASLGNSDRVQVGEGVVAIGSPLSLESTVSSGIVSGIRNIESEGGKFLQVTAPISPGSSGGPLFNMAGEVVGITTLYLKDGENLNFAIPVNDAKWLLLADSKVHGFPVESETAKSTPHEGAPSSSVAPTEARAYYRQLYDAGGFFHSLSVTDSNGKPDILTVLDRYFVCFNDDSKSQTFFTFSAMAYDERYAKASQVFEEARSAAAQQDARRAMQAVEQTAPYIQFFDANLLDAWPPDAQSYFRQGGRTLSADIYKKGVKITEVEYHGNENLWVAQESGPSGGVKKTKTYHLSIEPATLRYTETLTVSFTAGSGDAMATQSYTRDSELGSGTCEKIPYKQSN